MGEEAVGEAFRPPATRFRVAGGLKPAPTGYEGPLCQLAGRALAALVQDARTC